jgi:biopolymer transport protein TolR
MGMAVGSGHGNISAEPNVIPMIDILLVLLIIFMITQPLTRMALNIQVPPPVTAPAKGPSTQIVLQIAGDGSYAINGQPVPKAQLDMQIHASFDQRPAKLLFIKADPVVKYQEVIEAMDTARGAGIEVIGFTPKTG